MRALSIFLSVWQFGIPLLALSIPASVYAQQQAMAFERISTAEGLSTYTITSVIQDGNGFIWVGTMGGLNRYDGMTAKVFRPVEADDFSLSDELIHTIIESPKGSGLIWVGTNAGGLNKYDPYLDRFTRYQYEATNDQSLSNNDVRALFEDHAGRLWIGTSGGGLNRFDRESKTFIRYQHDPVEPNSLIHNEVWMIYETPSRPGLLWVGTSAGLSMLEVAEDRFINYPYDSENPYSFSQSIVTSMLETSVSPDTVWLGTQGSGLKKIPLDKSGRLVLEQVQHFTQETHGLPSNTINVVQEAHTDPSHLWVGMQNSGLLYFNTTTETFTTYTHDPNVPTSLSQNDVLTLCQDASNVLWVGTWGGLNRKILPKRFTPIRHEPEDPNSLSQSRVIFIHESQVEQDVVWIATRNKGVNRWDQRNNTYTHYFIDDESLNSTKAIYEDAYGTLWLAYQSNYIYQFDRRSSHVTPFPLGASDNTGFVREIYSSPKEPHILWIATDDTGIFKFDVRTIEILRHYVHDSDDPHSLSHNEVWDIYEDTNGTFWFGTGGGGLNAFDVETEIFTSYHHNPEDLTTISSNRVVTIAENDDGLLWLGTSDKGLNRFDPQTGQAKRYTQADGLPHTDVGGILKEGKNILWLTTSKGISRFDPRTETFTNFDTSDGFQDLVFHYRARFKNEKGELYVGGANGFNVFHPDSIPINSTIPNVVITSVLVDGDSHPLIQSPAGIAPIRLRYDQNDLTFSFAALDYTQPSKNQYKIMLDGADKIWQDIGTQRSERYPNLAPGKYTFRVIGSNNDGYWNREGTSVDIIITPPFWRTSWFWTLMTFVGFSLISGIFLYHIYQIRKVERIRTNISRGLHDDIGANLSSIALKSEIVRSQSILGEREYRQLAEISRSARKTAHTLREMVWVVNAEYDTLDKLLTKMVDLTTTLLDGHLTYTFTSNPQPLPVRRLRMEFRQNVYFLYKEAIHNIIKHAHATQVQVDVSMQQGVLHIRIQDDGIGFLEEQVQAGDGLRNMRKRAEDIRGRLKITSQIGQGTQLVLTAPIA